MKTKKELNADILKITMTIQSKYPELSKYIVEMPVTIPDEKNPNVDSKALAEYYDSLEKLLKDYTVSHTERK